jgi:hypothetical protein
VKNRGIRRVSKNQMEEIIDLYFELKPGGSKPPGLKKNTRIILYNLYFESPHFSILNH